MQEELQSLSDTNTWTLVERPKDKNVTLGKWVYKVKTKADGSLEKYKARYVAKGFKQRKAQIIKKRLLQQANRKLFDLFFL